MPSGLPDVIQKFDADTAGYIAGIAAMIKANQELVGSIAKVTAEIKALPDSKTIKINVDAGGALAELAAVKAALGDIGDKAGGGNFGMFGPGGVAQIRDYNRMLDEYGRAMDDAAARNAAFNATQVQTERLSDEGRQALNSLTQEYRRHTETADQARIAQAIFTDGLVDQANSTVDAVKAADDHEQAIARLAKTYGTAQETFAKSDFSAPLKTTVADVLALRDALASPGVQRLGGGYGPGWDTATAVAAMGAAGAVGGAAGGGGGGGRGRWSSAAYASSGGGDMFPVGSAGHDASVITGFVKRWWTPVHFAVMTANELLATLLPATAAAGAATLVGWQGVEQMVPRIQAINNAAESLGGAYGITSGSYLGTGSAIQHFQNLASGGVYELGGAGINLMRSGAGSFGQTGLSTIAMLDRGVADMQINMRQRGTMGELGGLAGKGTDYLRQLGDIGANFGNIFLGLAPHLPGVGDDYLSLLEGITGGLGGGIGFLNQHGMGNFLGAGMAGEAGWRIGRPVVGLAGKGLMGLGNLASKIGLGGTGLAEGDIADIAALTGMDLGEGAIGLGGGGLAGLLTGAGTGLGMLGGPAVAGLALSAFLGTKLVGSMPTGAMRRVSGMQAGIGQAGFTGAWEPLAKAITATTGLSAKSAGQSLLAQEQQVETPYEIGRFGPGITPTYAQTYAAAAHGFAQTTGDLVNAGPQLVSALKKAGLKSVSMGDAFQIAQNALLDIPHAFGKDGKLTKQALQMLTNTVSALGPMTRSGGAFNAAIGAQQIMSSPAMQDLSKVNQAMDSMTQIMAGGPAGMAGLFGILGGTPTTHKVGGINFTAPPAFKKMAQALTSFSSASGSAAWNTFAGSSGLVAAEQQNLDQLRTAMTLGAIGPGGAAGLAGFQIGQMLPLAKKSPAALAMLMQQGQQMGIGGYYQGDPSKPGVQAANYAAAEKAFGHIADSSKQANAAINSMTVHLANIPAVAKQFVQGTAADIHSQQMAKAAIDAVGIKGGINIKANTADLVGQLKAAGVQGGAALKASLDAVLSQAGVGKAERIKIEAQVTGLSQVQSQLAALKDKQVHAKVNVEGAAQVKALQDQIDALKSKSVQAAAHAQGAAAVAALNAEINALHSKQVTITTRMITIGGMAGVTPGIPAGVRAPGMQTGGMVPGSGQGDIIPAMLEPGEAIIPRYLVPLIAPILAAHRVPGFGGVPQSSSSHFAAGGIVPHIPGFPDPARLQGDAGKFAFTLIDGITKALNNAGAKKIADALITQIGKEVALAKNVSSAAMQGQGYGNAGLLGGMDVTPGTGGGTVLEQMQSYLGSVKSFTKDIATLRKDHLNKAIISQLVAAGPVQGDALAQSIMNDYGGVGGVNKVWSQLGGATKGLGAQAAMAQYGGVLAPNLKSGSFSSANVSININAGAGATLSLSDAQIKQVVAKVQAALLKQAKRNNKTGLQLPTKGA